MNIKVVIAQKRKWWGWRMPSRPIVIYYDNVAEEEVVKIIESLHYSITNNKESEWVCVGNCHWSVIITPKDRLDILLWESSQKLRYLQTREAQ